jgi:hypothetical protein
MKSYEVYLAGVGYVGTVEAKTETGAKRIAAKLWAVPATSISVISWSIR